LNPYAPAGCAIRYEHEFALGSSKTRDPDRKAVTRPGEPGTPERIDWKQGTVRQTHPNLGFAIGRYLPGAR